MQVVSDGTAKNTHVYTDEGNEVKNVAYIEIIATPWGVKMTLTLHLPEVDMQIENSDVTIKKGEFFNE